ncbi:MAG: hypothetical protein Athens101428_383 [Candidatus Berkelbacteria bacterium Athens1014_28]|uniref:DNA 3'-5' helicase n=1 Tax=Candidatus Berkelbacteria bacterium Athens1014_28 TaxID=2017145 RepID=A0A554LNB7_9BACT|nr:MAG: hypothetical protein Athens101428_383 [Candidatus Berkelbacteria bacterium Athens1014_28]
MKIKPLGLDFDNPRSDILSDLNAEQKKAVTFRDGPLLIVAGAGTGKTTVITRRIAYIIEQKLALPSEILALTFTEKAASEMEARVDLLVPYGFVDSQISTFHAFGDRLLRDFSIDLGLPANFKVLSQTEQAIFFRENLYAFDLEHFRPVANPATHIKELLSHFSRLKDELISPEKYISFAGKKAKTAKTDEEKLDSEKILELATAYQKYQDLMIKQGNLDFGDQIFLSYKLLKENPQVLSECQKKFKYILVDEFQDTNYAQYQLVKLIIGKEKNITVVGDDDQSIYRFRGASISNILSFKDDFHGSKQIVLNQNYRSTTEILDAAYRLIQFNNPDRLEVQNKIDKKLFAKRHGGSPELIHSDSSSCEADTVAEQIINLKSKHGYKNSDFAILARANNHLESFIQSLNLKNIPSVFIGSSSLFSQSEIKMAVSFLRCLVFSDDNLSFYLLATSEIYSVDPSILSEYYSRVKRENIDFIELFENSEMKNNKIFELISDIKKFRSKIRDYSAGEILYEFLKEKKYFKKLSADGSALSEIKITNLAKFFDRIYQFEQSANNKSLLNFLDRLELIIEYGDEVITSDVDPDIDAVNLMSAHAAKGLEWPVVFIVNMVSDRFPSRERKDKIPIPDELIKERLPKGDFHLQEERRLFYVASTRAKDFLFFTSADDYGGKRMKKISQFILEILDQPNLIKNKHRQSALEKIERHRPEKIVRKKISSKPKEGILKLSRQQIDDYFTCPKKYYYSNIIKIPLPLNWHFMYGTAIHEAIGRYFQRKIALEKPTLESLISDFNQTFISEGFITREHEEERKRKGILTLTRFYEEDQKNNLLPEKIEERFEFFEDNVKINGRYDLILKSGGDFIICDFKTSEVTDQKKAGDRMRESTQMKIYALAWKEKFGEIPKTQLNFIESGIIGERKFSESDLEKTKELIFEVAGGIRAGDYTAKPTERQCQMCPYNEICPESMA